MAWVSDICLRIFFIYRLCSVQDRGDGLSEVTVSVPLHFFISLCKSGLSGQLFLGLAGTVYLHRK
jgi:hypothetical protein